jgi:crotonobetainyl-CoA:carnitine CoA-transferase CaiB-like acyl-CoA transferase
MVDYACRPAPPTPDRDILGLGPLYRLYEASEGWVFLAAPTERDWQPLVDALSPHADAGVLDRFAKPDERAGEQEALADALAGIFGSRPAEEWEHDLLPRQVTCVAVSVAPAEANYLDERFGRAHGYVVDVTDPVFDEHPRIAPLQAFSRSATTPRGGCRLDQHTDSVLHEFGYPPECVAQLRARGIVGA